MEASNSLACLEIKKLSLRTSMLSILSRRRSFWGSDRRHVGSSWSWQLGTVAGGIMIGPLMPTWIEFIFDSKQLAIMRLLVRHLCMSKGRRE